ncbi:MAG: DUF2510 domain-containing protein [Acidimicrobiales bacterium]
MGIGVPELMLLFILGLTVVVVVIVVWAVLKGRSPASSPVPAGAHWAKDPTGHHELRWWDGGRWTDSVSDAGVAGTDPL